jgi:hypothetical protein
LIVRIDLRKYINWNNFLVLIAVAIAIVSMFFANRLTNKLAIEEKKKVELIQQALELVAKETENFSILAATVINSNTTIPLILTDAKENIITYNNIDTTSIGNYKNLKRNAHACRIENIGYGTSVCILWRI